MNKISLLDSYRGSKICLSILLLTFFAEEAKSQYSVYEYLTGFARQPLNGLWDRPQHQLKIKLKGRYDDLFRKNSPDEHVTFARWVYGASVDWKSSESQSWRLEFYRSGETFRTIQTDSSLNFESLTQINRLRIAHQRKLGKLPVDLLSYFQIYDNRKITLWNYGISIQGKLNNYRFGMQGEYKSWLPFFQTLSSSNVYDVELLFPALGNIQQLSWFIAGNFHSFRFQAHIRAGRLVAATSQERDYTFKPSAAVRTFMGSLRKSFVSKWQVKLSFLLDRATGDGILRFRDRKYGNMHLHKMQFFETRFSINSPFSSGNFEAGAAYQRVSGKANASVEIWPFDDSSLDVFGEKQSFVGSGHLALIRSWLQSFLTVSPKLQMTLLAEHIYVKPDARLRTWGSALIIGTGQFEQHSFDNTQRFLRLGLVPKLTLSKNLNIELSLNQWLRIGGKAKGSHSKTKGGTFGQVVLCYKL